MTTLSTSPKAPVILTDTNRPGYWLFGDHATFVATSEDTGGQFSLFDFHTLPQGGPLPHIHRKETEFAYILEGQVTYQMHDHVVTANAGSFVYKAKDHLHGFANLGTTPSRHLEVALPSGLENLFATIGQPGPKTAPPPPQVPPPEVLENAYQALGQAGVEAADSLFFAPSEFNFTKNGEPTVTILRPGEADGAVSVTLNVNGEDTDPPHPHSEISPEHVAGTQIQVDFADGERIKTVAIPIDDHTLNDANEVHLSLSDPTNGAIVGELHDEAILTVLEDNQYLLTNGNQPDDFPLVPANPNPLAYWLGGENYSFIATGDDTEGFLSLFDVFVPPQIGSESLLTAPGDQAFFVLDGNLTFQLNDQIVTAMPNTFVLLPKGNPYALTNLGDTPAKALLFNPNSDLEAFFAAVGTPGDPSNPPSPVAVPEFSSLWGLVAVVFFGTISFIKKHRSTS